MSLIAGPTLGSELDTTGAGVVLGAPGASGPWSPNAFWLPGAAGRGAKAFSALSTRCLRIDAGTGAGLAGRQPVLSNPDNGVDPLDPDRADNMAVAVRFENICLTQRGDAVDQHAA